MTLEYCLAVDSITADKSLNLRSYELFDNDWKVVSDLISVLQIFKEATLFFSIDNKPSIANVIPTMDRIDQMLKRSSLDTAKTNSLDKALEPSVKHALTFARSHLNKYYSKTDTSNVYRIAI
ncbi:hypothetical protein C0991_012508, partial [Blastosporella zonata]